MSTKKISKEQPDNFEFTSQNLSEAKKNIDWRMSGMNLQNFLGISFLFVLVHVHLRGEEELGSR